MHTFLVTRKPLSSLDANTTHVTELYKNLKRKSPVILFVPKTTWNRYDDPYIIQIPTPKIGILSVICYQVLLFYYLMVFYIRFRLRPKAIYLRQSVVSITPVIFAKTFGVRYIVEVNGIFELDLQLNPRSNFLPFLFVVSIIQHWMYRSSSRIIAVTPEIKDYLITKYHLSADRITVVGNGANIDLFKPMEKLECRKKIGLDPSYQYVGFVGNLAPWQGLESLVFSAPLVVERRRGVKYVIIGDGVVMRRLRNLIRSLDLQEHFILVGKVPYNEVPYYINACELMVAPFIKKRNNVIGLSPLKLFEYLACEKPVIASRIANLDFIEDQDCGILVEPENPRELGLQTLSLLEMSEDGRKRMGRNGRLFVSSNHSWSSIGERIHEIINDL